MPHPLIARLRTHRRGLRIAAIVLAALYALYLIAANIFLNSAWGEGVINARPERYHARWDWAMSLYPGHIHARGIVMGGHARTTRWTAASPRANGRIKLLPLLRREAAFGRIRAQDVSVHVARAPRDLLPARRADKPWTLRFDAITTPSLLRLDFYEARVTGRGDARFVFEKTLQGGPMEIGPSTLSMPDATLQVGEVTLLRDGRLALEIAIPAHIREQAQGEEKLVLLDARMRVEGPAPGLDLKVRNDEPLPIGTTGALGRLKADLTLERGVLMPGSRLDWSAPVFSSDAAGAPVRHPLGVALRTADETILIAVRVPPEAAGAAPWLRADLRVEDRRLGPDDWLRPLRALGGTVQAQWPAVPLRWIDVILDDLDWLSFDGRADLEADLQLHDGALQAGSRLDVDQAELAARVLDNRFSGQAHAQMRMSEESGATRTTIGIVLERFTLGPEASPGVIDLRGRDLSLDLASTGPLAEFHRNLDAHLRFDDAEVPDLRTFNRYLPGQSARLNGGSGQASGDIRLDNAGEMVNGHFRVRGQDVRLALGPSQLSGNVDLDSKLSRMQRVGRHYTIDEMAVRVDGVRLDGLADAAPWWAQVGLEDGTLEWKEPFNVRGRGQVEMRDVSVLLGLFAERSAFPRWIGNLIDSGEAHATGDLQVSGRELIFDRVEAHNDRIDLLARLRILDGKPQGDLYARWGILGLGVELDDGKRTLHIAGAREWFESQPPLLAE